MELYVDALEPLEATLGEVHGEVGYLYVKIGYLYGKKGDVSLSLLAYKAGESLECVAFCMDVFLLLF